MSMSADAEAFAALDSILEGRWDRDLHRLHGAIHLRQKTDEYRDTLVAQLAEYENSNTEEG
jgi:hypothetical protein